MEKSPNLLRLTFLQLFRLSPYNPIDPKKRCGNGTIAVYSLFLTFLLLLLPVALSLGVLVLLLVCGVPSVPQRSRNRW